MTKEEFLDLLERYIQGTASEADKQIFDEFYSNLQKRNHEFWSDWELTAREKTKLEIYQSLNKTLDEEERRAKRQKKMLNMPVWRVAASIAVFIGIGLAVFSLFNQPPNAAYITKSTERGQRASIRLSDGSSVRLNAGSTIIFPEAFSAQRREVSLTGEAFFEVTEDTDRPFVVNTGNLSTEVLGTSFNVKARPKHEYIEVTVATGRVYVLANPRLGDDNDFSDDNDLPDNPADNLRENKSIMTSTSGVILKPGEQAHFVKNTAALKTKQVSLDKYLAWNNDVIYLDNTPMTEVVEILGNWYDIDIELENKALLDCLITGKYKGDKLENILKSLQFMQGIEYEISGERQVTLNGKPCK